MRKNHNDMIGTIIGAIGGIASGIYGASQSKAAAREQKKELARQRAANEAWYKRNYYQDYLNTVEVQNALKGYRKAWDDQVNQARARQAVTGGTAEQAQAVAEAGGEAIGNVMGTLAAKGQQNKQAIDAQKLAMDTNLSNQQAALAEANQQAGMNLAMNGMNVAASALAGYKGDKAEEPVKQNVVEESRLAEMSGDEPVVETPAVAEPPKYKYTAGWWQTPNYVEAEKKYQEAGKKQMDIAETRAKRQRDLAIFGDLAKLGAQAYAKSGGAYKIDKFTPQTEIANEKLRKVRDNNAAQIMAYADRMRTAQQADAANEQTRMKAEYDYGVADAAAKAKAAKEARDYNLELEKQRNLESYRAARIEIARMNKAKADVDENVYKEYLEAIRMYPELAVKKLVDKYTVDFMGRPQPLIEDGKKVQEEVGELYPTVAQMKMVIEMANRRKLKKDGAVAGSTNASPLNKGKMSNNNKDTGSW